MEQATTKEVRKAVRQAYAEITNDNPQLYANRLKGGHSITVQIGYAHSALNEACRRAKAAGLGKDAEYSKDPAVRKAFHALEEQVEKELCDRVKVLLKDFDNVEIMHASYFFVKS